MVEGIDGQVGCKKDSVENKGWLDEKDRGCIDEIGYELKVGERILTLGM